MGSTTYNVLLRYLAFASMCYSLLSFYNELCLDESESRQLKH